MSYWDSSALVRLYVQELDSAEFRELAVKASRVATGSLTRHEVRTVFRLSWWRRGGADRDGFGVGVLGFVCLPTRSPAIQKFVCKPKHGAPIEPFVTVTLAMSNKIRRSAHSAREVGFARRVGPRPHALFL